MADSRISNGSGGNYRYELWRIKDNPQYYLKIWKLASQGNKESPRVSGYFASSREALDYFDCNYAEKSLPNCPK